MASRHAQKARAVLVLGDQALSSVSNFLVALLVGRWLGPSQLGSFTLALAIWFVIFPIFQSLVEDPLVILGEEASGGVAAVLSGGVVVALVGAIGLAVAGSVCRVIGVGSGLLFALAAVLPLLLIQDLWRRLAFLRQRPVLAVYNDALYLAVEVLAFALVYFYGTVSGQALMVCWGLGAGAGVALGVLQFRPGRLSLASGVGTLRRARHLSAWLTFDLLVNRSARQAVVFIVAIFAGRAALGGIQAATNLLGFTNVLVLGGSAAALAEGSVALRTHGTAAMRKAVRMHVIVISAGVGLACLLFAIFSRSFMELAYGHKFDKYVGLAPIIALQFFVACLDLLPVVELRLRQRTRQMFTTRLLFTPLGLAGALVLSYSWNARGGAFATVAIAGALSAGAWFALRQGRLVELPRSEPESIG